MRRWSNIWQLIYNINNVCNSNRLKEKIIHWHTEMITWCKKKKHFTKSDTIQDINSQHSKNREPLLSDKKKKISKKSTANIILNDERINVFSEWKQSNDVPFINLSKTIMEFLTWTMRQNEKNESSRQEMKMTYFTFANIENP